MSKVLIIYYSCSGNTKKMAELVAEGVKKEKIEVMIKSVKETEPKDLLNYEGIIIGSPTYYGGAAAPIRDLIDKSVKFHGKLEGKVGGAFTSSGCIGGGNETTILSILTAMLIHGMVIQGASDDDHYGPVAIEAPDKRAKENCLALGQRVARLVKKLYS
jgi:NAD(P)H dehydrogenase (quinone)